MKEVKKKNFVSKLQDVPIFLSGKKMFILCFITTMENTLNVAYQFLNKSQSPLKFILTYKMSQDHIELYFGCIRARGGSNNNPNSVQFKNILRQLLFIKNMTVENGNCFNLDSPGGNIIDFRLEKLNFSNTEEIPDDRLEQYLIHLDNNNLSYYVKDILDYISGYIIIIKKIIRQNCINLLVENRLTTNTATI